jgi:hypothetical protein
MFCFRSLRFSLMFVVPLSIQFCANAQTPSPAVAAGRAAKQPGPAGNAWGSNLPVGNVRISGAAAAACAATGPLTVDARSDIFASGHAVVPGFPDGGGVMPPCVRFAAGAGKVLTFSGVTGLTNFYGETPDVGPRGSGEGEDIESSQGISGMRHDTRRQFLTGVFLSDAEPANPAPAKLDFTGNDSFTTLSPLLNQQFLIGDGRTGSGTIQQLNVPANATRLFLGFPDANSFYGDPGFYDDNTGSLVATFTISGAGTACGTTGPLTIDARADTFASGHASVPAFDGGGGVMPPCVRFAAGAGQVLTFSSVTGLTNFYGDTPSVGPRGSDEGEDIESWQGISGMRHDSRRQFLAGVFLSDAEPANPAPAKLNFTSNDNFTTLSPLLNQQFLIGNGRTSSGTVQQFNVPASATRLFLGFPDAFSFYGDPGSYDDNTGSLVATFSIGAGTGGGPKAVSVEPASGTWGYATYAFTFSDPAGWQAINVANVLINNFIDGRNACYLAVVPSSSAVYLVDNAGNAGGPYQGMTLPGSGTVQNSQCSIAGPGSSISGSGTTLTITLAITLKPAFAGNKVIYLAARESGGANSGWQAMGTVAVPGSNPTGPAVGGVTPARSSGSGGASFVFTFTDTNGWQDLGVVNILINDALNGNNACYLAYSRAYNTLYLMNNPGTALLPGLTLNGAGTLSNSQCTITGAGSSASGSGTTLTLTLNMAFPSAFAGNRIIYMAARSNGDALNSGWQAAGSRTVQ